MLQQNEKVLRSLCASLLMVNEREITYVHIENPMLPGHTITEKDLILDVLVCINHDQYINLEMQVKKEKNWTERSIMYEARMFDKMDVGENYDKVKTHIHVGILNFKLTPDDHVFYSQNLLIDKNTSRIYSSKFGINVLSLKNIKYATEEDKEAGIYDWARFLLADTWEELFTLAEKNSIFQEAIDTMGTLSEDAVVKLMCDFREIKDRFEQMEEKERQKELDDLNAQIEDKKRQIEEKKKEIEEKKKEIEENKKQIAAEKKQNNALKNQIEDQKNFIDTQNSRIAYLEAELLKYKK